VCVREREYLLGIDAVLPPVQTLVFEKFHQLRDVHLGFLPPAIRPKRIVLSSGFRYKSGFAVSGSGFAVSGSGFAVSGFGFRARGSDQTKRIVLRSGVRSGFVAQGLDFRFYNLGFRVRGFEFRDSGTWPNRGFGIRARDSGTGFGIRARLAAMRWVS